MPQMAPYNWLMLNVFFTLFFLTYIILLNFIPFKKNSLNKNIKQTKFLIKW